MLQHVGLCAVPPCAKACQALVKYDCSISSHCDALRMVYRFTASSMEIKPRAPLEIDVKRSSGLTLRLVLSVVSCSFHKNCFCRLVGSSIVAYSGYAACAVNRPAGSMIVFRILILSITLFMTRVATAGHMMMHVNLPSQLALATSLWPIWIPKYLVVAPRRVLERFHASVAG